MPKCWILWLIDSRPCLPDSVRRVCGAKRRECGHLCEWATVGHDGSIDLFPSIPLFFGCSPFFPFFCTQLDRRRCSDDDRYRRSTLISCFIRVVCSDVNPNCNGMNEWLPRSIPRTLTRRSYKDRDADVALRARIISSYSKTTIYIESHVTSSWLTIFWVWFVINVKCRWYEWHLYTHNPALTRCCISLVTFAATNPSCKYDCEDAAYEQQTRGFRVILIQPTRKMSWNLSRTNIEFTW